MRRVGNGSTSRKGKQRANLITQPDAADNAYWTKAGCASSANTTVAPSGQTTGDTLTNSAASETHDIGQAAAIAGLTAGVVYRFSARVRPGTQQFISMSLVDGATPANYAVATFDLTNRLVTNTGVGGDFLFAGASIEESGNGYFDCTVKGKFGVATTARTHIHFNADGNPTYAASGRPAAYLGASQTIVVANMRMDLGVQSA